MSVSNWFTAKNTESNFLVKKAGAPRSDCEYRKEQKRSCTPMYKVLIVDDEPFILQGLKRIIAWEEHGLEIVAGCSSAEEALEWIGRTHIHILITDIWMPGMNGLKLIQLIRERKLDIKCIILSGHDDFEYVKESL